MPMQNSVLQSKIIAAVFKRLTEEVANGQRHLLDDDLLQLRGLFGDLLERALDVLDTTTVTCYRSPTGDRQVLEVPGSTAAGSVYKLLPNTNYCTCSSFRYQVIGGGQQLHCCKHVLACKLAAVLGRLRYQTVSAQNFDVLVEHLTSDDHQ